MNKDVDTAKKSFHYQQTSLDYF